MASGRLNRDGWPHGRDEEITINDAAHAMQWIQFVFASKEEKFRKCLGDELFLELKESLNNQKKRKKLLKSLGLKNTTLKEEKPVVV